MFKALLLKFRYIKKLLLNKEIHLQIVPFRFYPHEFVFVLVHAFWKV